MFHVGEICELEVTSLSHDGRAVGRLDGQLVVFVQDALPFQKVRVRITTRKKSFAEAQCLDILENAPDTIEPACPHAHLCGGCSLQALPYDKQLYWKKHILYSALSRIGGMKDVPLHDVLPSPLLWGYRNKMTFAFGEKEGGALALGLRMKGSHTVLDVHKCKLMPQECMDVLDAVRTLTTSLNLPVWTEASGGIWRFITVRRPVASDPQGNKQCLVHCITAPADKKQCNDIAAMGQKLLHMKIHDKQIVTGFVHEERSAATPIAQGEKCITRLGQDVWREELGAIPYVFAHDGFFQVNTHAATKLCEYLGTLPLEPPSTPHCFWDIFCGVGAPGLNVMAAQESIHETALYGVDVQRASVHAARINAARATRAAQGMRVGHASRLGLSQYHYRAGEAHERAGTWPSPHTILLDPPRAGLHKDLLPVLLKSQATHIIYISCNPATLARDLAQLTVLYDIESVQGFDFFPHTTHVESCTHLVRKKHA